MNPKYSFIVSYSPDKGDECYIVQCREFPSILTHGDTPWEALDEMKIVMPMVIGSCKEDGTPLPQPIYFSF